MKMYLAGEAFGGTEGKVNRRLFSYWYNMKHVNEVKNAQENGVTDCFLDSGAFTAFTKDVTIDIEKYAEYVKTHRHLFTVISNLDAVGKDEQTNYNNLKKLESLGAYTCPVFHAHEDERWLEWYVANYDYVLLGGMVPESSRWLLPWLDNLWGKYLTNPDGTAKVKVHGFGLTDQVLMFRYPWHSVDSTSWLFIGMYGHCMFFIDGKAIKITFSIESQHRKNENAPFYSNLSRTERRVIDSWLEPMGVTAQECAEDYVMRNVVNAISFQKMEDYNVETFKLSQGGFF